ncbi:hypothetical protein D1B32_14870 [Oceanobacillus profundus]|uniref:Uncharacterized protein n=1 Tax=Oceanobacillus profundus TaxID=372463 RepID=A0A417YEJ0_9BACI|nr:hypothetical protein CHI07_14330 [Paenibacillus sp. 7884-2]RHW31050.1 hypothetical protein D1B32_14870 [Oceanobacillus profundus]
MSKALFITPSFFITIPLWRAMKHEKQILQVLFLLNKEEKHKHPGSDVGTALKTAASRTFLSRRSTPKYKMIDDFLLYGRKSSSSKRKHAPFRGMPMLGIAWF